MGAAEPARILIIKLGAFGDFIQALGPMAAIRRHHPEDHITLLTTTPFEDLARQSGYVDDVWIDTRPKWHNIKDWLTLRRRLNDGRFVRIYDLQNNDRTGFYFKLFSSRPEWVGAAKGASHQNASKERTAGKAFDGHVQTLALAGIKDVAIDRLTWMAGRDFPDIQKPYVLIVPGSAANHPEKRWPKERYIAFCKRLIADGYHPVLIGGTAEENILKAIEDNVPGVRNLCGQTTLQDIAALGRSAAGCVGNDTGPMHIIAPTGCKTLVLFSGKTKPSRHAPVGDHVATLQNAPLDALEDKDVYTAFISQQNVP